MQNWNFTKCIRFLEFQKTSPFILNTAVKAGLHWGEESWAKLGNWFVILFHT